MKGLVETEITSKSWNKAIKDCLICNSSTLQESQITNDGSIPVYGANGIIGTISEPKSHEDSILIIKDGSGVGTVRYVEGCHAMTGTMNYLTPNKDVNLKYIFFALKYFDFQPYKTGMAIPHIYFRDYGKAKIYCPDYALQTRIADRLTSLEKKIHVEQHLLNAYTEHKNFLLRKMFI